MAPHSSTLAWKILWTEEPGRPQSMGLLRVGHDWETSLSLFTFRHWRRKWQPTPVFLPGESQGRGSLMGCHLWGRTESDMTEATQQQQQKGKGINSSQADGVGSGKQRYLIGYFPSSSSVHGELFTQRLMHYSKQKRKFWHGSCRYWYPRRPNTAKMTRNSLRNLSVGEADRLVIGAILAKPSQTAVYEWQYKNFLTPCCLIN